MTRKQPVANEITWFIMHANGTKCAANRQQGFSDCGFFPVEKALRMITYAQDKSLVRLSYEKYKDLVQKGAIKLS